VPDVRIRPSGDVRDLAQAAFEKHRRAVLALLPDADVEHVGATAVPGALTKGDVDVLVRVDEAEFPTAVDVLSHRYAIHQPHSWTPTLERKGEFVERVLRDRQGSIPETGRPSSR
jgi:GrpB-like predicted nucleotidyltransferase (UPF0157 family)